MIIKYHKDKNIIIHYYKHVETQYWEKEVYASN